MYALFAVTRYAEIIGPLEFLLSLPACNGEVERVFGKCKAVLTPWRKQNALNNVLLRANAPFFELPGYPVQADLKAELEQPGSDGD